MSDSSFRVKELSQKMNLGSSHFYRLLKHVTEQTPNIYLENFRLLKVAKLLSKTTVLALK